MFLERVLSVVLACFVLTGCPVSGGGTKIERKQFSEFAAWNDKMPTINLGMGTVAKKKAIVKAMFECQETSSEVKISALVESSKNLILQGTSNIDCAKEKKQELYFFTTEKFLEPNISLQISVEGESDVGGTFSFSLNFLFSYFSPSFTKLTLEISATL